MKRWRAITAAALALAAATFALALFVFERPDPTAGSAPALAGDGAVPGVGPAADQLARGAYLTRAADCFACHTVADSHRPYAGGVGFRLPFGTIYSSNITADPIDGIGAWSDAQFVRAMREGVGRHGEHLYPAFPYTSYTGLSLSDVLAIKAYLLAQRSIQQPNRRAELAFPFNQRWAMSLWNAAFFKSRRFVSDAARSPEWNRGAYLATALGHCAECHTPRNLGFGLRHGAQFAGQELQGWRAYNITADPRYGIGSWSNAELLAYLSTGHCARAVAAGPMGEVVAHSLQYLAPADLQALVEYLRSVPARSGDAPIDVAEKATPAARSTDGRQLFEGACASCHQWNGAGRQSAAALLLGTRSVHDSGGLNVTQAILQGANLRIGTSEVFMPAFGRGYSDVEVAALANYVIEHFGGQRGTVTDIEVAKRRRSESTQ